MEANDTLHLVLLEINLNKYSSEALDTHALEQLDTILSEWAGTGTQLILRFLYDWNGEALTSEPDSIEQIMEHMDQTAEIVNCHTDCVFLLQGIYLGNCGEMNNSNWMDDESMIALITHLAEVTDPSIYLSVRTPAQWRTITGLTDLPDNYPTSDGSLLSRLGLFNDGILGSDTDLGTYGAASRADASSLSDKWTRDEELAFQEELCLYVPNGGEVVYDTKQNDLDEALTAFTQMHISYLNCAYDLDVIEKWKNTTYESDDLWNGCSGYEYIESHLGYRYALQSSALSFDTWRDDEATLSFTIENTGFAPFLRTYLADVSIYSCETNERIAVYQVDSDLQSISNGKTTEVTVMIPVRELDEGSYCLYFNLYDEATGEIIYLASSPVLTEYGYSLGAFTVGEASE